MTKDDDGDSWEALPVSDITEDYIYFETDHFSLFAVAEEPVSDPSEKSGGGGGCFIHMMLE
jgi:hypothetical protein